MNFIKRFFKSKMFHLYCFLLINFTLIEMIFRFISGMSIISWAFLRIFIGLNMLSIIFSLFFSYFSKKIRYISSLVLIFIATIYAVLQLGFNSFLGVYISINTSSQLGAVTDYIKDFISSFKIEYYLVLIPFITSIIYIILMFKNKKEISQKYTLKNKFRIENGIKTTLSGIVLIILGFCYAETIVNPNMQNPYQAASNLQLLKYPSIPSVAVQNFGIIGFGLDDIRTLFIEEPVNEDVYYANEEEDLTEHDRIFDDRAWEYVISNETNKQKNTINNYLISNRSTKTNEYTGLFEGKNVIVIMMESAGEILINKEYYPNFYKMYSEGFSFENNYSPRNSCATGNNEFSAITSLYSIYNNCTCNLYKNNTYYQSLMGLFNSKGYNTVSMHDYTNAYYERTTIHPNYGAQTYYGVEDLGIDYNNEYRNWASDEDFAKVAMDIVLESGEYDDSPFMLWMTTVTSHQPYSSTSISGEQYLSLFEDLPYDIEVKRYMSKLKNLDNALGILMNRLQKAGKLDDTVFVLFGDHYPYGISTDKLETVLEYSLEDYENERTPFTIYNSKTKAKTISKYTSYINITPTVANLFDLDYDPRLYMGEDVLSDEYESMVVFADGSWKNDKIFYNAKNGSITSYKENDYTSDEIIQINKEINSKMTISSAIIKNNYFEYLNEKLEEAKDHISSELANNEEE